MESSATPLTGSAVANLASFNAAVWWQVAPATRTYSRRARLLHAKDASAHAVVNEALATSALNIPDSAARQSRTAR